MYVKGMKVKISAQGHENYGFGTMNPRGVIGIVSGLADTDDSEPWYSVDFLNGVNNDYQEGDLDVIEDIE